jgi:preprotein translocase subunit SecA
MRIFAGPWVKKFLESVGWQEGEAIQSPMVSRRIESAQKKIEERNFEIRKNLLEYDEINDVQRKRIYEYRQAILDGTNCRDLLLEMIEKQVGNAIDSYLSSTYGAESFAVYAAGELSTHLDAKMFRGEDYNSASMIAQDEAERAAETDILSEIDQNLPEEEEAEWNWRAMADFANRRWQLNLNESQLKKIGRDEVAEFLIEKAREAIQKIDLSEGEHLLDPDIGIISAARWSEAKFGIQIDPSEFRDQEAASVKAMILERAVKAYDRKEAEYPVMAGMYQFSTREGSGMRLNREPLVEWAARRFGGDISVDDLTNKDGQQIHDLLLEHSQKHQQEARHAHQALDAKYDALVKAGGVPLKGAASKVTDLQQWLKSEFDYELPIEEFEDLDEERLKSKLISVVEDHYHPEMRRMERFVLLEVVDSAWKDHLLSMDYLRSAVGQRGMAQQDPKVEYKREGMRLFEELWKSIDERTTELIFRMEQLDEGFVSSTWVETSARHEGAQSTSEIAQQQQQAIEASNSGGQDAKVEPIRNRQPKVGRNDPCPCGSGKKYKQCCLKHQRDIA